MMCSYKKTSIIGLLLTAVFFVGAFFALYLYDPLHLFRPSSPTMRLHTDMYQQVAGVINNYEFDSAILGTSMLENTSANRASEVFGGNFANISLAGSTYAMRRNALERVLSKKKIKTLIYSIDHIVAVGDYQRKMLYNNYNRIDDFHIYLNKKYLNCLLSWSQSDKCLGVENSLDRPANWMKWAGFSARFGGLDKWLKFYDDWQIKPNFELWLKASDAIKEKKLPEIDWEKENQETKEYLDSLQNDLIDIISTNKKTEFILLFPPYSRQQYAIWAQYGKHYFQRYIEKLRYLIKNTQQLGNVTVYGFDTMDFVADISYYKDLYHHSDEINQSMLDWIKQGQGRLTNDNIEAYITEITELAESFDLHPQAQQIRDFLATKKP